MNSSSEASVVVNKLCTDKTVESLTTTTRTEAVQVVAKDVNGASGSSSNGGGTVILGEGGDNIVVIDQTRIQDASGSIGTIAYKGPVASSKDAKRIYYGVVWDNPHRGKHNGSVQCRLSKQWVQHFTTQHPTGGSFVCPKTVTTGRSLTPAVVEERYVPLECEDWEAPNNVLPHVIGGCKPAEFLGEAKIRKWQQVQQQQQSTALAETTTATTTSTCCNSEENQAAIVKDDVGSRDDATSAAPANVSGITVIPKTEWSLRSMALNRIDTLSLEFSSLCVHQVTQLDLAGNLFCTWQVLWDVVELFPNLQHLSLACNRLRGEPINFDDDKLKMKKADHPLVHLNLRQTGLTPRHLAAILPAFPNLRELSLAQNDVCPAQQQYKENDPNQHCLVASSDDEQHTLFDDPFCMARLQWIDATNTNMTAELVLRWFSRLPALKHLNLDDNPIENWPDDSSSSRSSADSTTTTVVTEEEAEAIPYFPSLQHLQLSNTLFSSWTDLQALDRLTASFIGTLTSLSLRTCPLLQQSFSSPASRRRYLIARFATLQMLNASSISKTERESAERDVLRRFSWAHAKQQQAAAAANHPTTMSTITTTTTESGQGNELELLQRQYPNYNALMETHADFYQQLLATSAGPLAGGGSSASGVLQDELLTITIRSMVADSCTKPPLIRRVPSSLTLRQVLAMCSRYFDPKQQSTTNGRSVLLLVPADGSGLPSLVEDDYGGSSGDADSPMSSTTTMTLDQAGLYDGAQLVWQEQEAITQEDPNRNGNSSRSGDNDLLQRMEQQQKEWQSRRDALKQQQQGR